MHKKIVFDHVKLHDTHWKEGDPKNPKIRKKVVVVYFKDEGGIYLKYRWSPLKGEVNEIVELAKAMITAEDKNFTNLKNPEKRKDIEGLLKFLEANE